MAVLHNLSIDADPQQQEAASPLMLVVRSSSRYMAWAHSQIVGTASASVARQAVRCTRRPAPRATGRDEGFWYAGELARASVLARKVLSSSVQTWAYTGALHHV
jgi:hypothetical protein